MKESVKNLGYAFFLVIVLPGLVLRIAYFALPQQPREALPQQMLQISVLQEGIEKQLPLEEYLVGVILQEMPASFSFEAKKAQAVVARTYALRTCQKQAKHGASVCTDHTCCQAYITPQAYLEQGGSRKAVEAARRAAQQTVGQVLTYAGDLIDATYFSCSGGFTEDAVAVWGADVPYLRSVESPGEEKAEYYVDTVIYTLTEFAQALGITLPPDNQTWLGEITRTAGGGVDSMVIAGKEFHGTQLRSLLQLRSTAFTVTVVGDRVSITTRGHGHRVGMSQYGADAMAAAGKSYGEILSHYYREVCLENYSPTD